MIHACAPLNLGEIYQMIKVLHIFIMKSENVLTCASVGNSWSHFFPLYVPPESHLYKRKHPPVAKS